MAILRLAEDDRERYGLPEDISYRPNRWSMRSVGALRKQTGYSIERLNAGMDGFPVIQADGSEVIERDFEAWAAFFWLILWDSGHRIPWADFDLRALPTLAPDAEDEAAEADEGKASTNPDTDSANGTISFFSSDTSLD